MCIRMWNSTCQLKASPAYHWWPKYVIRLMAMASGSLPRGRVPVRSSSHQLAMAAHCSALLFLVSLTWCKMMRSNLMQHQIALQRLTGPHVAVFCVVAVSTEAFMRKSDQSIGLWFIPNMWIRDSSTILLCFDWKVHFASASIFDQFVYLR